MSIPENVSITPDRFDRSAAVVHADAGTAHERAGISGMQARLAGWLYLGTIGCGLFAELAVRSRMRAHDASATALNIAQNQGLYRAGEAADLVMLACYIVVTALFYRLFLPAGRSTALVAAGFSMIGIAVLAVAGLLHLVPLALLETRSLTATEGAAQFALELHGDLYGISLFFFGVYCTLIGWLGLKSRLLPRIVAGLMIVGGATHNLTRMLWVLAPEVLRMVPQPVNMLPLAGEAALAVWLIVFGIRRPTRD